PDSSRANILLQLTRTTHLIKPDSNLIWAQKGLLLAKKTRNITQELSFLNELAIVNQTFGNYPEAMLIYMDVLRRADSANLPLKMFNSLTNIGSIYSDQKDYREALRYELQALQLA